MIAAVSAVVAGTLAAALASDVPISPTETYSSGSVVVLVTFVCRTPGIFVAVAGAVF